MSEEQIGGTPEQEVEELSKEPVPITGGELVALFKSEQFMHTLRLAADYTRATGHESGLSVFKDIFDRKKETLFITGLEKGGTENFHTAEVEGESSGIILARMFSEGLIPIPLLSLHFHPGHPDIIPIASEGDLFGLNVQKFQEIRQEDFQVLCYPLAMIGEVDENGNCVFLLLQERFRGKLTPDSKIIIDDSEQLDNVVSREKTLSIFRNGGYRAEIIRVSKTDEVSKADLKKIQTFAFKPEVVEKKDKR